MFLCSSTGGLVMMGAELPKNWYEYLQKNWYWLGTGRRSCVQLEKVPECLHLSVAAMG